MTLANCRSGICPTPGDQDGNEWRLQNYFEYNWDVILRHPDTKVRQLISNYARHAALNDNCGYSQANRLTFWEALSNIIDKDPKNITIKVDADCSSSTAAIIKAVGYAADNKLLKDVSPSLTTFDMDVNLMRAGFESIGNTSESNLQYGDVLLNKSAHVVIAVANSDFKVEGIYSSSDDEETAEESDDSVESVIVDNLDDGQIVIIEQPEITTEYEVVKGTHVCRPGEYSYWVFAMQYLLKENKYWCQADGYFAIDTSKWFLQFQKDHSLDVDCQCGEESWKALALGHELMITNEGYAVRAMQYLLKAQNYFIYTDGIFGSQAYQQLTRFQKSRGLNPSGVCDEATWAELTKI